MSISSLASSSPSTYPQNAPTCAEQQFALAIQNNDAATVQSFLQKIDRSNPAITTLTKLALISDTVNLEVKEKLFEGSEIDIHEEIFHGESALAYAKRREDTALLQVLTKKPTQNLATTNSTNIAETTSTLANPTLAEKLEFQTIAGVIAGATAGAVAVFIDKGMIETISGKWGFGESIRDSVKQLIPGQQRNIAKAYLAVGGACAVTYSIANAVETTAVHYEQDPMLFKLPVTTLFNTAVSIKRDTTLSKLLIPGKSAGYFSRASIALFIVRDGLTMLGVFGPQTKLRQYFQTNWNLSEQRAAQVAQVVAPAIMQFGGALAHTLGIDFYNNPNMSFANRWATVKAKYSSTLLGRVGRIGIAYGAFANFNTYLRGELSPSKKL